MHVVEQASGAIRYFNQNGLDSYHCKTCQHHPHLPRPQRCRRGRKTPLEPGDLKHRRHMSQTEEDRSCPDGMRRNSHHGLDLDVVVHSSCGCHRSDRCRCNQIPAEIDRLRPGGCDHRPTGPQPAFVRRRAQHAPGRRQQVMATASEGARGQIAGRATPLYADARTEGVKTASRMAWMGGAQEFSAKMEHERGKRSTGEDWGRAVDLHMRGAG